MIVMSFSMVLLCLSYDDLIYNLSWFLFVLFCFLSNMRGVCRTGSIL